MKSYYSNCILVSFLALTIFTIKGSHVISRYEDETLLRYSQQNQTVSYNKQTSEYWQEDRVDENGSSELRTGSINRAIFDILRSAYNTQQPYNHSKRVDLPYLRHFAFICRRPFECIKLGSYEYGYTSYLGETKPGEQTKAVRKLRLDGTTEYWGWVDVSSKCTYICGDKARTVFSQLEKTYETQEEINNAFTNR